MLDTESSGPARSGSALLSVAFRTAAPDSRSVAFLDSGIAHRGKLAVALPEGVITVALPAGEDALAYIARWLENRPRVARVHLFARGAPGRMMMAGGDLTLMRVSTDAATLARIGRRLGPGGALLLYGSRSGEGGTGRALVAALADATGIAVAASSAPCGTPARGGRWALDVGSPVDGALDLGDAYDGLI